MFFKRTSSSTSSLKHASIEKVSIAGGAPTVLAEYPVNPKRLSPLDVDATGVYWITTREIRRLAF